MAKTKEPIRSRFAPLAHIIRNQALDEAAATARANTSAPRIWQDGKWHNPHGEEIAKAIEALKL